MSDILRPVSEPVRSFVEKRPTVSLLIWLGIAIVAVAAFVSLLTPIGYFLSLFVVALSSSLTFIAGWLGVVLIDGNFFVEPYTDPIEREFE